VSTPKRDSSSHFKSPLTDLFTDDNLTECQAVPSNLFSPMRQAELVGGKIPRYQDIPLDYNQPRSVDSNLDTWLYSPGGPSTPGEGERATPTPSNPRTPGPSSLASYRHVSTNENYETKVIRQEAPLSKAISKDIDVQIDLLAKSAENNKLLKSEIFKQMNNVLNEAVIIDSEPSKPKLKPRAVIKPVQGVRVIKSAVSPIKPDLHVSRGSWRFSTEPSLEPFVPVVKVRNDSLTRPMVLSTTYEMYHPLIQSIIEKEKPKKHALKDKKSKIITKKQKLEEASESLVPVSRKVNYLCKDCGRRCSSLRDVKAHLCLPKVQCEDCKPAIKKFQNRKLLIQHLSHSHPAVGQKISCAYCEKGAHNKTYLRDHVKKFHPMEFIEIYSSEENTEEQTGTIIVSSDSPEIDSNCIEVTPTGNAALPPAAVMHQIVASNVSEHQSTDAALENEDIFEEDIDAPDSVLSTNTHDTDEVVEATPQPFAFHCDKCRKGFHTSLRHNNHKSYCGVQKRVSITEPSSALDSLLKKQAGSMASKRSGRRRNARFEQLKTNWSELLGGRERCGKCGRNNYREDDLEKHLRVCRGTLLCSTSQYVCPHCTQPARVFNTDNAMRRHVSTNHAKEAMEEEWDYQHDEEECKGLAENHLFR